MLGGAARNMSCREDVQAFFAAVIPLTDMNMLLRRNFLMFLHGCNLHGAPHASVVIGPRSVIKSMSMPYFDRALMEFLYHVRG